LRFPKKKEKRKKKNREKKRKKERKKKEKKIKKRGLLFLLFPVGLLILFLVVCCVFPLCPGSRL
jgi:uncharacterized membrane protein